jgi:hypothetical protein
MVQSILALIKKQRIVCSWALIVGLFLVLIGHAPVLPVVLGGALAILITTVRSASAGQPKPWQKASHHP